MTDRTFTRTVIVGAAALIFALAVGVVASFVKSQSTARESCERVNRSNAAYVRQWTPVLSDVENPRPPLRDGATPAERTAYEKQTALRDQFRRDLHAFEPVRC